MMAADPLPQSMAEFADVIGESATMSLIQVFGGGRIYVPKSERLDLSHPLVRLLGMPLAERLAARLGGERYDIPMATAVRLTLRNDEILSRFREGASVRQIASSFGISKSSVWQVIRGRTVCPP